MGRISRSTALTWVAALLVAIVPLVVTDRFVLKVLTYVGLNVLVVTGLALLFGYAGQVSLGHAAFVGLGAYTRRTSQPGWICPGSWRSSRPGPSRRSAACCSPCRACASRATTWRWRPWDSAS